MRETITQGTTTRILAFIYDESGRPFALIYTNGTADPVTYYYVLNLQGDVVKLIGEDGTVVAEYAYNAWGEILSSSGSMADINPLRYRGYYYDTETGFYYLQSRYYDPVTHRFINADNHVSTGQGFIGVNMLAYCNNNPIIFVDLSGTKAYLILFNTRKTIYTLNYEITISYSILGEATDGGKIDVTMGDLDDAISISTNLLDEPIDISVSGNIEDSIDLSVECSESLSDKVRIGAGITGDTFHVTVMITDDDGNIHNISLAIKMRKKTESPLKVKAARKSWEVKLTDTEKIVIGALVSAGAAMAVAAFIARDVASDEQHVYEPAT